MTKTPKQIKNEVEKENKNLFRDLDNTFERRKHGCDGCHNSVPTQRFDGWVGGHIWLCSRCYVKLVKDGLK